MKPVTIYTSALCAYCAMAKHLLKQKNVTYREISLSEHFETRTKMLRRVTARHLARAEKLDIALIQ